MKWWRLNLGPLRDSRLGIHLENADLSELRLEYADLRAARLDHAVLHGTNLRHADIRKACLNHADLSAAVLEYADLSHADLDGAELSDARLEHAKFNRASLDYADLQFARLDHANFTDARLGHARFWRARLTHSNFGGASLKNANFCYAQLEHADFTGAGLELASFWFARLEHTNLRGACLTYARLPGARLDHADVRGATGILFDENPVDGLHIEGNAPDPWSLLRRKYTGPRFFFHLILLIAFLLPFAARVLILSAHSQMYETAERIVEHAGDAPGAELWAKNMADWTEKYRQTHDKTLAVWVLAGWTKGWHFFGLTLVLVMYNLLRAYLTSKVSMLRDAEERSKITPALVDYYGLCHPLADLRDLLGIGRIVGEPNVSPRMRDWPQVWWRSIRRNGWRYLSPVPVIGLYRVHLFARVLFWAAMGSFAYNAIAWLSTTWVWVPKS